MFDTGQIVSAGDGILFVAQAGNPNAAPIILLHSGLFQKG